MRLGFALLAGAVAVAARARLAVKNRQKPVGHGCPPLPDFLEQRGYSDFPNLDRFPLDNYRIKYKKRADSGIVSCRKFEGHSARAGRALWMRMRHFARLPEKGRFACRRGQWAVLSSIPECFSKMQLEGLDPHRG